MENENLRANQAGLDTNWMARGDASETERAGEATRQTFRGPMGDAKQAVADAVGTAKGFAQEANETAKRVLDAGHAFSQNAVNAAGEKIDELKGKMDQAKEKGTRYMIEQPVQSVLIAAVGGAMLTALFLSATRGTRR